MKRMCYFIPFILMAMGCTLADVKVDVVSERTALENQVLGTYNAIDQDMLLVASVRGVDPSGSIKAPPRRSREQQDAIAAMQLLDFHADDLQRFKTLGWIGEDNMGLIAPFEMERDKAPTGLRQFAKDYSQAEFDSVVKQVNDARRVVMGRVIALNENLSDADLPEVQHTFGRLNAEKAAPGEKIQQADGAWVVKEIKEGK